VVRQELATELCNRLAEVDRRHAPLLAQAAEIVVFGSRALGVNRNTSDLDVLCITENDRKIKTRDLDCLCISRNRLESSEWLGSELASHVARYGVWLRGDGLWRQVAELNSSGLQRKQCRVASLIKNVHRGWPNLHILLRRKYRITVRRELQRLRLLQNQVAIPPTPVLDLQWTNRETTGDELLDILPIVSRTQLLNNILSDRENS
jgi:predicted nucleotidyltransferase